MGENCDTIPLAAAEKEDGAFAKGIQSKMVLDKRRKAVDPLPHIGVPGGNVDMGIFP